MRSVQPSENPVDTPVDLVPDDCPFFDAGGFALAELDAQGRYVRVNAGFSEVTGFAKHELAGQPFADTLSHEHREAAALGIARVVSGELPKYESELRIMRNDGAPMWIHLVMSLLRHRGRANRIAAVIHDISDKKSALELLGRQLRLFNGVASTTPDFVYVFDRDGRFLYANRRLLDVWGMALGDIVGKTCRELGYEQWHHDMHMREIAQVISTKKPIRGEVPFKAPLTGIYGVYEYIFTPVLTSDGSVDVIAGTTRDVTERKKAEESLRNAERRHRMLAHVAEIGSGAATSAELMRAITQYVAGEFGVCRCGFSDVDLAAGTITVRYDHHGRLPSLAGEYRIPSNLHYVAQAEAGRIIVIEDADTDPRTADEGKTTFAPFDARARLIVPLHRSGKWAAQFWLSDPEPRSWTEADIDTMRLVADRIWSLIERKRAEETFRSTFENAAVGIAHVSPDRRFIRVNRTLSAITGYPREELLTKTFVEITHPDDVDADLAQARRLVAGEMDTYSMEKRYLRKDGTTVWVNLTGSVVRNPDGLPLYFIAIVEDITRRRTAESELAMAQAKLQQHAAQLEEAVAQRTAQLQDVVKELSTFSYSVSHDLRAPLRSITGFADILLNDHIEDLNPEAADYLRRIVKASRKMDSLIRDVLAYSRVSRTDLQFENVLLSELVESLIESQFPEYCRFIVRGPLQLTVRASRVALQQCIANLLSNAIKFRRLSVPMRIVVSAQSVPGAVRIEVEDNGIGFPPEFREKVWRMFERLHHGIEGTGVGLAIVRRSVERMSGHVGVDSMPGIGSKFWIELPTGPGLREEVGGDFAEGLLPLGG